MADDGQLQQGLARDINFIGRIGYAMGKYAILVKGEPLITPGHTKRATYASIVLGQPLLTAAAAAMSLVGTTPLTTATTTFTPPDTYTSDITDANLLAAVEAMWNTWAGV